MLTCGLVFSTGLVRGILSGVAVDVGSNIAKQSDPSNGSQKPKAMTVLNVQSLLFYIQFLNSYYNFIVYYKNISIS